MKIIENKKLSKLLNKTIGVDTKTGIIVLHENDTITDITNEILELVVIAIEDKQTIVGLNRVIEIYVRDVTKK